MRPLYFLCLLLLSFLSFPLNAQDAEFSLTGKTSGIDDGTYLYLRDLVNGGELDSAIVSNNRFRFETELPEPKLYVMLHTRDRSLFRELWLNDVAMIIDATAGPFHEANVSGSRDQDIAKKMKEEVYKDVRNISQEELKQRKQKFMNEYPDALASAYLLDSELQKWDQEEIELYFDKLSETVQTSSLGKRIAVHLAKDLPEVGEKFVDFSIPDQNGKVKNISELTGKFTLLQFWSSSCGHSRRMNEVLKELYAKYEAKGLEIISISDDLQMTSWQKAIEDDELPWPQLCNFKEKEENAFGTYGINSTPSNFLLDQDGIIIARDLRDEELEKKLYVLMGN